MQGRLRLIDFFPLKKVVPLQDTRKLLHDPPEAKTFPKRRPVSVSERNLGAQLNLPQIGRLLSKIYSDGRGRVYDSLAYPA